MDFREWEPVYERILDQFGFSRKADEAVRDTLAALTTPTNLNSALFADRTVAVAGAAPTLEAEVDQCLQADVTVAASDAGVRLDAMGYRPAVIVTDLDGDPTGTRALAQRGTLVVIHAHGDNQAAIERWVPEFPTDQIWPTTQAAPVAHVQNTGGFTDGDRAAFLADQFGAAELCFPGWQFTDQQVGQIKRQKLRWAARLLYWLETRRETSFAVLDDIRKSLSLPTADAP